MVGLQIHFLIQKSEQTQKPDFHGLGCGAFWGLHDLTTAELKSDLGAKLFFSALFSWRPDSCTSQDLLPNPNVKLHLLHTSIVEDVSKPLLSNRPNTYAIQEEVMVNVSSDL